ncbi:MAG: class I SAM-dependent methyltransferase [Deltaproteobacteria bacterium]|nr:MAG: class I SAM-dependent methyltransferase [Deltaproteobacteria bacterium]
MRRTVEPELMDDEEQARAYASADFSASDTAFVEAFQARFGAALAASDAPIADLGCGPGNIALRLAHALPQRRIVAVDGAEAMLALGRERARTEGRDNVDFVRATLPSDALPPAHFGAIVSNSLLHHLHDPSVLWRTVAHIGRPGAPVYVGDLRRPPTPEAARAIVARYAGDAPPLLQEDYLASLHAAFEPAEVASQLAAAGLGGLAVEAVADRYLLVVGRLPG